MMTLIALLAASTTAAASFTLSSQAFHDGGTIGSTYEYSGYGCTGKNVSPALRWTGVPPQTKSFALTVWDPDAPHRGGWWHWVLFDIPGSATSLAAGAGSTNSAAAPPESVEGTTSFGKAGYGGPCPPPGSGSHHYIFTLYALDEAQAAGANGTTGGPALKQLIAKHVLGSATLTGRFARP
ncbi:MAG TPA: YbhB/YbcL family Raf kinase inhibitor-like protein [Candidatus Eremiobacteraceae bacterium]|nr:YbhB/YbcL family Raf kinase inhibitor-like protein [Candidatus Eremiobacteraceae bacterium]